jgi:hypothetical protein
MDTERTGSYEPGTYGTAGTDRLVADPAYVAPVRPVVATGPAIHTGENLLPVRNRVQWGPIIGGLVSATATMVLLTVLGIAVGASVLSPRDSGQEIGTWAAVWGAVSAIVSFYVGGWVAAKTAAVGGSFAGLMNGLMVGATGIVLILWMTSMGLGNLFGTLSANLGEIANMAQDAAQQEGVTPTDVQVQADEAQAQAGAIAEDAEQAVRSSFDEIRAGAFGTFLGLLLPLVAAALGGFLGYNKREELLHGTGT